MVRKENELEKLLHRVRQTQRSLTGMTSRMANLVVKKGKPPGSLNFVGQKKMEAPIITVIEYGPEVHKQYKIDDIEALDLSRPEGVKMWVNVDGIHDEKLMGRIREKFGIHPLIMEDILNTTGNPKITIIEDHLLAISKMVYDTTENILVTEQVSIVMGSNFLISFQEQPEDVFDAVRKRIKVGRGRARSSGYDYLAYILLDSIIDEYIEMLVVLGAKVEELEDSVLDSQNSGVAQRISELKKEINHFGRIIRPMSEAVSKFLRAEDMISDVTKPFIKDLEDHILHAHEITEGYRNMLSDQLTIYHTTVSTRLNEVMKVLTIFSVIFIPITFLAGVYGMNFEYLPELQVKSAYYVFWGIVGSVIIGMLLFFRSKRWL